jgi:hypothetical protein
MVPLVVLAAARIGDLDGIGVLLGVVRLEQPTPSTALLLGITHGGLERVRGIEPPSTVVDHQDVVQR